MQFISHTTSSHKSSTDLLKKWSQQYSQWAQRIAAVVIFISLLGLIWALPTKQIAEGLQRWTESLGYWGASVYLAAFVFFTVCSLPVWPMPFIAGALFGTLLGTALASLSIAVAATVTFWLSRFLRRTWLREHLEKSPRMRALEKTVEKSDWKAVAAIRVSHMLTFGMQNYAFGLTHIGFRTFVVTTVLVTFPGTLLQVYLGDLGFASVDAWRDESAPEWQAWAMRLGGLAVIAAAVIYIGHLWRTVYQQAVEQQLRKELESEEAKESATVHWSWSTVVLIVFATSFASIAVWAVADREAFRQFVMQLLAVSTIRSPTAL